MLCSGPGKLNLSDYTAVNSALSRLNVKAGRAAPLAAGEEWEEGGGYAVPRDTIPRYCSHFSTDTPVPVLLVLCDSSGGGGEYAVPGDGGGAARPKPRSRNRERRERAQLEVTDSDSDSSSGPVLFST